MIKIDKEWLLEQVRLNRSDASIAKDVGCSAPTIAKERKRLGVVTTSRYRKLIEKYEGKRFGKLVIVEILEDKNKFGHGLCRCLCDCGNTTIVVTAALGMGNTQSCGCIRSDRKYKGVGDLSQTVWGKIVHDAIVRDIEVNITIEEAWELFEKQGRRCALTGVPITLVGNYYKEHRSKNTASLDRIDSSKGYSIDNVQWVHRIVNIMKNEHLQSVFVEWCRKIVDYTDKIAA